MSETTQQAMNLFEKLNEQDQFFVIGFLERLGEKNELEQRLKNAEYLARVQRAIEQVADGRGIVREIIEVSEDD